MNRESDLLFGLLALQMNFISKEQLLECAGVWMNDPGRRLGRMLQEKGYLPDFAYAAVKGMVEAQVKLNAGDPVWPNGWVAWRKRRSVARPTCQQFTARGFFAYRCDRCHKKVLRPARQLFVFCGESCRRAHRAGRRRLRRNFRGVRTGSAEALWNRGTPDSDPQPIRGPPLDEFSPRDMLAFHEDLDPP